MKECGKLLTMPLAMTICCLQERPCADGFRRLFQGETNLHTSLCWGLLSITQDVPLALPIRSLTALTPTI